MNKELYYSYNILKKVYFEKAYAGIELNKLQNLHKGDINTGLVTKIVYGVLENDIRLEYVVSKFIKKAPEKSIELILKIGAYVNENINSIPTFALVNELVNIVKKYESKFAGGFVNATLKNIIKTKVALPSKEKNLMQHLSIKYSYPNWLVERFVKDYGEDDAEKILASKLTELTHIRINTNKTSIKDFISSLTKNNIAFENGIKEDLLLVDYEKLINFKDLETHYVVQGLPSVITALNVCQGEKGKEILDLCSAPGGKSVLMAENNPKSNIISADIYPHRLKLVEKYRDKYEIQNIKTLVNDASKLNKEWIEKFDFVLCDVPCSNTGVIGKKPDVLLNRNPENVADLRNLQMEILKTASNYVKPNGILVYSTCSILKEENIDIIKEFLKDNKNFELEEVDTLGLEVLKQDKTITFLPHLSHTEGFFIGRMKRK